MIGRRGVRAIAQTACPAAVESAAVVKSVPGAWAAPALDAQASEAATWDR